MPLDGVANGLAAQDEVAQEALYARIQALRDRLQAANQQCTRLQNLAHHGLSRNAFSSLRPRNQAAAGGDQQEQEEHEQLLQLD